MFIFRLFQNYRTAIDSTFLVKIIGMKASRVSELDVRWALLCSFANGHMSMNTVPSYGLNTILFTNINSHAFRTLNTDKPRMKTIVIAFLLSIAALHTTEAVNCYKCTAAADSCCNDPYSSHDGSTCIGMSCYKSKTSASGSGVYSLYLKLGTSICSVISAHKKG